MASPLALDSDLARMEPAFPSASFLDTRIRSRTHVTSRNLIGAAGDGRHGFLKAPRKAKRRSDSHQFGTA
jgi:hypothetical protein